MQMTKLDNGKEIDNRLVGVWVGSESNQQIEGVEKSWEMNRKSDGTFELDFTYTQEGETHYSDETGKWWIENGIFHEFHDYSGKTDLYSYEVLNKDQIKFSAKNFNVDMVSDTYEFIDTRKKDDRIAGTSIEKAIKVNSVTEEYEYVRENCADCKIINQELIHHKGNPYDVLNLEKKDGTRISYYFDIKSFFGKF